MVHRHIKSLPHHPKRVVIISLTIALALGIFGYIQINKKVNVPLQGDKSNADLSLAAGAPHNLTLGFLASGRIKSVSVKAGDKVVKGQILASLDAGNTVGALTQARAAYASANASYQKVQNGASGPAIDVAKVVVANAQTNLTQVSKQQDTLVVNARRKLFSDGLVAVSDAEARRDVVPVITGNYDGAVEGSYHIFFNNFNDFFNGNQISFTGLEKGTGLKQDTATPLGTKGLSIYFPEANYQLDDKWVVDIPNKNGVNYVANLNAYQSALQTRDQANTSAQSTLAQAEASLALTVATARPEDAASAQAQVDNALGAVQIAEATFQNTIITAPADGTILSVAITEGQIAMPNAGAIEFISN
ncbi:MAG: biotin/lipoyl-binding protein [bacterium]